MTARISTPLLGAPSRSQALATEVVSRLTKPAGQPAGPLAKPVVDTGVV